MSNTINRIKEVAEANREGFTIDLTTMQQVTSGIIAAYNATQDSFDTEGLATCIEHAEQHDNKVGGWFNTDNGRFYFDSVRTFTDLNEAKNFGIQEKQIAIFDLDNDRLIKL